MPALDRLHDHPDNPIPPGATVGVATTADRRQLRFATFAPHGTPRGTVLLLQGRAEFIERWFETVRDLQVRGFAVVAFDWRGQGGSERMTRNPRKGHVANFRAYDRDLAAILDGVVATMPGPLYVLAHSTGGLIAVANAPRLAGRVRRLVMTAPFFGLGEFAVSERVGRILARAFRLVGLGRLYVPGGNGTPILTTPFAGNRLTSDPARHARGATISRAHPDVAVGSPSIAWIGEAFAAQSRVFAPEALEAWTLPTLIFAGGEDRVVSNAAIERFVVTTRSTELIVVPGARHELLHERDRYREQFWAAFGAFVPGTGAPLPTTAPAPDVSAPPSHPEEITPAQLPVVVAPVPDAVTATATLAAAATFAAERLEAAAADGDVAPAEPDASVGEGELAQEHVVEAGIAGGDDAAALGGGPAGPGGDDAAGPLDDGDQRDDVVGLEPALDHRVDETGGDHAVGVAVDPVTGEPRP